jgi:enoyl-CoA hydratase/carnithine racemase
MFNKKITTAEAEKLGLVTEVIPSSSFDNIKKKEGNSQSNRSSIPSRK